jgi:hypothetical protein
MMPADGGVLEVKAAGMPVLWLKAVLTFFLPLGGIALLLNAESPTGSDTELALLIIGPIAFGAFGALLIGLQMFSARITILPSGLMVRSRSFQQRLWPWPEVRAPRCVGVAKLWGGFQLGRGSGSFATDHILLTRGQVRALLTCPYHPNWTLTPRVEEVLGQGLFSRE